MIPFWMTIAAFMVFLMQAGFLLIEAGLVRSKNSTNVAQKNVSDLLVCTLCFVALGFAIMFGTSYGGWFGMGGVEAELTERGDFASQMIFNLAFCSVVATIVSGAVAERMKIGAYLVSTAVIAIVVYPVFAHWVWGGSFLDGNEGVLEAIGFVDHAGGISIHALGGIYALVAAVMLGARQGRFDDHGNVVPITGHSSVLALVGGLILFVCWVPFNTGAMEPGSEAFTNVALATVIAAAAGGLFGMILGYVLHERTFDPMAATNGMLGGLVAVTTGVAWLGTDGAIAIGAIGGIMAIGGQHVLLRTFKVDDPVGAASVHGLAGIAGGVLFPLFASEALPLVDPIAQMKAQAIGAGAMIAWATVTALVVIGSLKRLGVLRVSAAQEHLGLNFGEHLPGVTAEHLSAAFEVSKPAEPVAVAATDAPKRALTDVSALPTSEVGYALTKMTDAHREKAEELAATLSTLETALEAMGDGMAVIDASGEAVQVNAAFKSTMGALGVRCRVGTTRQELGDAMFGTGLFHEQGENRGAWMAQFMGNGSSQERSVSTPDGQHFIQRTVPTESGGVVVSLTDVTAIEEGRRAAESAQQAKAEFLANMSHEIRTPMNGIIGMADLLSQSELTSRQQNFVGTIQKCGTALVKIINDILDFSKMEAGQAQLDAEPFALRESVDDVTTLLTGSAAEKGIDLLVRYQPDLPDGFVGDAGRIRQILTNLIGNAIKFTHSGHVLVQVEGRVDGDAAALTLSVQDTGIGIPAAQVDQVFEKFRQVDGSNTRRYEGTGLGLSITQSLVEMMGGTIGVESVEGEGSTFVVRLALPVSEEEAPRRAPPVDIIGSRILIVDDNAVNREILAEQIAHWKCESAAVDGADKGVTVLRKAREKGVGVDLVIVDYQMPGRTGEDFYDALRADAELAGLPVIMLSSVNDDALNQRLRAKGLTAILTKPAPQSLLLDTIAEELAKAKAASAEPAPALADAVEAADEEASTPAEPLVAEGPAPELAVAQPMRMPLPSTAPAEAPVEATAEVEAVDILVAEDNETNRNYIEYILDDVGASYAIVENGEEAVSRWRAAAPKVILMDVSMPVMNGHEATRCIRSLEEKLDRGRTPIVALTAHTLKGDREKCLEAGMDDYMSKPVSVQGVKDMLEKWGVTDEALSEAG